MTKKIKIVAVVLIALMSTAAFAKKGAMINQLVIFEVKPEYLEEFKAASIHSLKASQKEPGNVEMKLYSDDNAPNKIYVYSRWKDTDAQKTHGEYDYTIALRELAGKALKSAPVIMILGETNPAPDHFAKQANAKDEVETLFFIFKIKSEYLERVIDRFETHVLNSRQEEGNLFFDFYTVEGDETTFVVYENWRNKSAVWDIHMKQPYAEITGALLEEAIIGNMDEGMNLISELK